ncbi:Aminomethyltransferase (glycine cleavage system T protein) [Corynebacterium xerosis]|nr:Aminomethyltransferase (glycine cleavage system T protein) [Corynebacterium xerosis]
MSVNQHPRVLLYPRIRKSPFFYASRRHGVAMYSVYNHTYHPRHYGDPIAEYWALLEGVTLWDVGVERQIEISGPDAFDFTNLLITRDLSKCAVGQCKYVFLTDQHGGILNDPILLRLEENRFWLSLADSDILLWARGVATHAGMDVSIEEIDVGPVQVQGPKSYAVMRDLLGDGVADIRYYYLHDFQIDGIDVTVSRTGYTGEIGYEIYVHEASKNAVRLWEKVWGGRAGPRAAGHRAVPYPSHRGRHARPRSGHHGGHQSVRDRHGLRLDGGPRPGGGLHRQAGPHPDQGRRPQAQARGARDRRPGPGHLQRRVDDRRAPGPCRRHPYRRGHLGLPVPAPGEEHRVGDGLGRALRGGHDAAGRRRGPGRLRLRSGLRSGGRQALHRPDEGTAQERCHRPGRLSPSPHGTGGRRLRCPATRARAARVRGPTPWCAAPASK